MDATSMWRNCQVAWLLGALGYPRDRLVKRTLLERILRPREEER